MIRPPVEGFVPVFLLLKADVIRWGSVAFNVLKDPMVSMSITVLNALADKPEMGAMKFPAAPALDDPKHQQDTDNEDSSKRRIILT